MFPSVAALPPLPLPHSWQGLLVMGAVAAGFGVSLLTLLSVLRRQPSGPSPAQRGPLRTILHAVREIRVPGTDARALRSMRLRRARSRPQPPQPPQPEPPSISTSGVARAVSLDPQNRSSSSDSDSRMRLATLSINDGIYDIDLKSGNIYSSSRLLTMLGLPSSEASRVSTVIAFNQLIHPDDREGVDTALRETLHKGRPFGVELRIQLRSGRYGWFHARGDVQRGKGGKPQRLAGFLADISERKESELALKRSEASLAEAQSIAKLGNWEIDPTTHQLFWSKEVFRIFGLDPDGPTPALEHVYRYIHPDDRAAFGDVLDRVLRHGEPFEFEMRNLLPDGSSRVLHSRGRRRPLAPGMPSVIHGTVQDITERKQIEEEQRHAKEAAEAASRAKSFFLANMSHEIRTPMNGILGLTEVALCCELSPEVREHLHLVKQSGEALLNIVNDILDFSKIEAGKLELEETPFDLHELLASAMRALSIRTSQKDIEILYRVAPDVPTELIGDPHRFRQIVMNLVGNAIKFTPHGEVEVSVEASPIEPGAGAGAGESGTGRDVELRVSVRDTGIGIPAEMRDAIFAAFVQGDTSTTRKFGGTGLGLAIASQLVTLMRGRLWVQSELGHGSTFHFTARMARQARSSPAFAADPRATALVGASVLIVDDNGSSARLIEQLVQRWHMKPEVVNSGEAALERLRTSYRAGQKVHVLIVDNQLLDMSGLEVVWHAQNEGVIPPRSILMLGPADLPEFASGSRSLGVDAHLAKPLSEVALRDALCEALASGTDRDRPSDPSAAREPLRIAPLDVLVAEDNPVNQRLARLLLERAGHRVSIARDGQEAVQMTRRHVYDVVMMDIQMPQVDGLSATALIRQDETGTGAHVPIIAMTAHVMKGDRERCLAHGMDDYVSKPVTREALDAALAVVPRRSALATLSRPALPLLPPAQPDPQRTTRAPMSSQSRTDTPARATDAVSEPDRNQVADDQDRPLPASNGALHGEALERATLEQRLGDDPVALIEIIDCFTEDCTVRLRTIESAAESRSGKALAESVHTLKGAVASFSVGDTYRTCQELEQLARRSDWDGVPDAVTRLRTALHALLCHMQSIRKEYAP